MIDSVVLNIETRTGTGTRISRKLRKDSKIPGILYSHGQNAELITHCHKELLNAIRLGKTVVSIHNGISIDQAVIREIQWDFLGKDPVHVDLGRVNANEKIKVHVSVLTKGISPGVTAGGVLDILMHSVDVECIAADAPKNISINIEVAKNIILDSIRIRRNIILKELDVEQLKCITNNFLIYYSNINIKNGPLFYQKIILIYVKFIYY